jgi:hypothetical protein
VVSLSKTERNRTETSSQKEPRVGFRESCETAIRFGVALGCKGRRLQHASFWSIIGEGRREEGA